MKGFHANRDFLVVTGGSAGGHLASLVALTANDPAYQPGFEQVDTSVRGCVAFYGVYDFADRHGAWHHDALRRLLERQVMKASLEEAPEAYEKASPVSCIHPGAPPFLVIHGNRDTLAPVEEARRFCDLFRRLAHGQIAYAEIPGAQHAFEIFPSRRAQLVIHGWSASSRTCTASTSWPPRQHPRDGKPRRRRMVRRSPLAVLSSALQSLGQLRDLDSQDHCFQVIPKLLEAVTRSSWSHLRIHQAHDEAEVVDLFQVGRDVSPAPT